MNYSPFFKKYLALLVSSDSFIISSSIIPETDSHVFLIYTLLMFKINDGTFDIQKLPSFFNNNQFKPS